MKAYSSALQQKNIPYSKLLALSMTLREAQIKKTAVDVIQTLKDADTSLLGLPCEDVACKTAEPKVYAATIDTLLAELAQSIHRWPTLEPSIGALLLRWRYCNIRYQNRSHDLIYQEHQVQRIPAGIPSPSKQQGWYQWGFEQQDPMDRLIPYPALHHGLQGRAKAVFLHHYIKQQCVPDPITGRTPYDPVDGVYYGSIPHTPTEKKSRYPYAEQWAFTLPKNATMITRQESKKVHSIDTIKQVVKPTAMAINQEKRSPKALKFLVLEVKRKPPPSLKKQSVHHKKDTEKPSLIADSSPPIGVRHQIQRTNTKQPHDPYTGTEGKATSKHFQGTSYTKWNMGSSQQEFGISALWTPLDYFYIRAGISTRLPRWGSKPSYTWGLGYSDWHPGTWSIEFNQWILQPFGGNTNIRSAVFNLGYQIPFPNAWQPYLSGSLNAKLSGNMPSIGGVWHVNYDDYFIRFGIEKTLRGTGGWQWVYGFGRWNWQAGSINIEYDNWGSNKAFQKNFRRNGSLLLEYRWEY